MDNQTPLHYAAKSGKYCMCNAMIVPFAGQLPVSNALLAMGANANARDSKGQTPLHLAAEVNEYGCFAREHILQNDYPEVVKLFLKMKNSSNRGVLTAVDENGLTCAHIAAMKGYPYCASRRHANLYK